MTTNFVDPADRTTRLERQGDALVSPRGVRYPMRDEVPDFTQIDDSGQAQTAASFGYKWTTQPDWGFRPEHQEVVQSVWRDVFGWNDKRELEALMRDRDVLDAGCGSGTALLQFADWPRSIAAVDISEAVYSCRQRFGARANITYARADLTRLPFAEEAFDVIWCAGVLHHTPDTFASLSALVRHLRRGGTIIFYVYVKKGPIREFADDHIRSQIADLPPAQAWRRMEALTKLARQLTALRAQLVVEDDVPEIGVAKGTYDLQRFVYYHLFKCFWNDALTFDDNVHVNFDWYHPRYAHRHTPEEVRHWLDRLHLIADRFHVSPSGIAVVARRDLTSS